jgi:hypothetical protein
MDIYFCDLCGVRVTDIDLKGGHGLRSSHDVICANCLELGHGKDWLARRQAQLKPTPASASIAASGSAASAPAKAARGGESRPAAAALLDRARDRARTAEEDNTPAIAMQVLTADHNGEEALAHAGHSELEGDSGPHAQVKPDESSSTSLSAAASSFSALSAPSQPASAPHHHSDDLDDKIKVPASIERDDTERSPILPDDQGTDSPFSYAQNPDETAKDDDEQPSEQVASDDADRRVSAKDETLPSERPPVRADSKSTISPTTPTKRSSTKTPKAKTGKLSGRTRAKKTSNRSVILISCITLPLLLVMIYLQFIRTPASHGPRKVVTINISDVVKKSISDAHLEATLALHASPMKAEQLAAAKDKIQAVTTDINNYVHEAEKAGMSEEDIERALEAAHWQDVFSLIKNLNDERMKLQSH